MQEIHTAVQRLEDELGPGTYHKRNLVIVRGQGARLWDEEGKEYIDCVGGQGAANLGHQNPYVNRAIIEQSQKLINCTELFYNDQRALLLEKLAQITPPRISKFFLCNSGAESVEGAFKFARLATGRTRIVAAMRETLTKVATEEAFEKMFAGQKRLSDGLDAVLERHNIPWSVTRSGASVFTSRRSD